MKIAAKTRGMDKALRQEIFDLVKSGISLDEAVALKMLKAA